MTQRLNPRKAPIFILKESWFVVAVSKINPFKNFAKQDQNVFSSQGIIEDDSEQTKFYLK